MYSFEKVAYQQGYKFIAGVDEAGRGPLAGPVVAAAVVLPAGYQNPEINDSKQLSAKKRELLYEKIKQDSLSIGLGVAESPVIDEFNILQATLMAMRDAVQELSISADYLLIDGKDEIPLTAPIPQKTIIKGDSRSISVAAASIIAKVSRDLIMELYHRQFPQYNFQKNKGYGTEEHREAIRKYGICKIHRRTFRVKDKNKPQKTYDLFMETDSDEK